MQLNDQLLARLDQRAGRERRSRSALIREAVERYLAEDIEAEIDRQIVEGYTRIPPTEDPWLEEWSNSEGEEMVREEPW